MPDLSGNRNTAELKPKLKNQKGSHSMMNISWGIIALFSLIVLLVVLLTVNFFNGKRRAEKRWQAMRSYKLMNVGSTKKLEILPLIDWNADKPDLQGEAGVSYLIKTDAISILFDVGLNAAQKDPSPLLQNMQKLQVSMDDFDAIVISHNHLDHVGGLKWQKKKTFSLTAKQISLGNKQVYTPIPMTYPGLRPQHTPQPTVIADGVALSGTIPNHLFLLGAVEEQALVINVESNGLVFIVGCGHQTLYKLLHWIKNVFDEPLYGIIGGLHYPVSDGNTKMLGIPVQKYIGTGKLPWQPLNIEEVRENIRLLQSHAIKVAGLSAHDSCEVSIEEFRKAFGQAFREIKVGKTINLSEP